MAAIPIVANFESDFVLQLVQVDEADTMDTVAEKCAHHSLNRRVKPRPNTILRVRVQDAEEPLARDTTVAEAGIQAMETIEVFFEPVPA